MAIACKCNKTERVTKARSTRERVVSLLSLLVAYLNPNLRLVVCHGAALLRGWRRLS